MAVSAPATAPNNPAPPAAAGPSKRGRPTGSVPWNDVEGLIAFKGLCHADEKQSASSKDERYQNAKVYYDATIVQTRSWCVWVPEPTSGSKTPEQSILVRTGKMIYERGKELRKWLNKMATGFADLWRGVGDDGEDSYDNMPSGTNDLFEWWTQCEEKVFAALRATEKGIPAELKLAFRYVCPDSPYLDADAATGATDALPNAALQFFGTGDKRFCIDPRKRLQNSNKGATQARQKLLARATSSLGGDPRTPGVLEVPQAPMQTPQQEQIAAGMLRLQWGMEQFLTASGIDMTKAPTGLPPQQPATAPPPQRTPFASGASADPPGVASAGTGVARGAAQGDPEGDADSSEDEGAGLDADANRDGGDDSGDDGDVDAGGDGDNTPPSPPSPGEIVATQRRASSRARKAPRRSL